MRNIEDVETFMLKHGESIVDTLGSEVDRIEQNLKVCFLTLAPKVTPVFGLGVFSMARRHALVSLRHALVSLRHAAPSQRHAALL